ncbi:zinc-binding dehydrogenase [Fodinicola acaciae]|uniref:zinc-binding dehydrogenase n=1 Tax=Fodinicola acaciae TaxID=2681555 RepID=UPI0013D6173E|nr:zinc-binding dehydrogenase [Fodinicola acaciae]
MRAIQIATFGGPEVLAPADLPEPVAGPGEVLVQTAFADVILLDARLRSGAGRDYFPIRPPYVPGGAVAGTVVAAEDPALIGRPVGGRTKNFAGYAEKAVIDTAMLAEIPPGLATRDAAALLHDGVTAYALMSKVSFRANETVLITAAAGGLGILFVQLAKAAGARVIGAARGDAKLEMVRKGGADLAVDYSEADWTDGVSRPDLVLDGAGGAYGQAAFSVVADGGRFVGYGTAAGSFTLPDPADAQRRGLHVMGIQDAQVTPEQSGQLTRQMFADAAAGRFAPVIDRVYPLEKASEAHTALEQRTNVGKVLLKI